MVDTLLSSGWRITHSTILVIDCVHIVSDHMMVTLHVGPMFIADVGCFWHAFHGQCHVHLTMTVLLMMMLSTYTSVMDVLVIRSTVTPQVLMVSPFTVRLVVGGKYLGCIGDGGNDDCVGCRDLVFEFDRVGNHGVGGGDGLPDCYPRCV